MATKPLSADGRAIALPNAMPAPPAAVVRLLARYSRDELASFIAVAIDLLDLAEGDNDVEANGDELDSTLAEDDFCEHRFAGRGEPGCPVSDPGEDDDPDSAADDFACDDEWDRETEQLGGDVPALPTVSFQYDIVTDQRLYLGVSNLMSSFQTNGSKVLSADSGYVLTNRHVFRPTPGTPV